MVTVSWLKSFKTRHLSQIRIFGNTYTGWSCRTSGPCAADSFGEFVHEGVPSEGVRVSVNVGDTSEALELIGVLLARLLTAEPLVLTKSAFNRVDHLVKCCAVGKYQNLIITRQLGNP